MFCCSLTRIVYVPKPLQRPVPSSFLKECYFRKCSTSSMWSISPSRCRDHRQYFGMDWRIYHVLPPYMGVNTTKSSLVLHRKCCYFLVEKSHCPGRSRQYPLGPWRVPFSQSFSRTELATTKIAKVTRDNDLTSQEEFSRPGPGTDVIPNVLRTCCCQDVRPSGVRIRQLLAWCLARLNGTRNCIYWEMASLFSRIPHVWSDSGYTPMRQSWESSDNLRAC